MTCCGSVERPTYTLRMFRDSPMSPLTAAATAISGLDVYSVGVIPKVTRLVVMASSAYNWATTYTTVRVPMFECVVGSLALDCSMTIERGRQLTRVGG